LLEQYEHENQIKEWQLRTHRFMGVAGSMGAMKLHDLCKEAETGIDSMLLTQIKQETGRVMTFLDEKMS
jgi:HPt (histidine-containing phosphotransfer) domain-containing protein